VRAFDNVPILSYFLLRGRCRSCSARFSIRYPLIEALLAALAGLLYARFVIDAPGVDVGLRLCRFVIYFAFTAVLVTLAFIDLDTKRLPDVITLPSIPIFFLAGFAVHHESWMDRAIGAAAGYLGVRLIADGYYYLTGREGLGLGDGKLLAVVGALLGWKALPPTVFVASFVGILISVPILILQRRGAPQVLASSQDPKSPEEDAPPSLRRTEVPFGPFLVLSALGYLFFADPIWSVILSVGG
jgi:leader peptidase (prepilin peptidase) / N-methyltransferase